MPRIPLRRPSLPRPRPRGLPPRAALPPAAVLLVLLAGAAAHAHRPAPYGDRIAAPGAAGVLPAGSAGASAGGPGPDGPAAGRLAVDGLDLRIGPGLEAYDARTGRHLWSYRRRGAAALHAVRSGGDAVVVWDDGLLTAVRPAGHRVRWHRAVPGLAAWLRGGPGGSPGPGGTPAAVGRARTVLQPVDGPEPWLGVFTPALAMGFRDRDGDLRWILAPPRGCAFAPDRAARTDAAAVVARPCTGTGDGGRARTVEVAGYGIGGRLWRFTAGPQARPDRLDGRRVAVWDGPVLGVRVVDAVRGAPVPACGDPALRLAAEAPAERCPAGRPPGASPADR
ncbi:hypothetical protein [Streptomyces sp. NPDC001380]|uniref:hypothetical protein n=1 Tax=Streptomyces sp. NPDC001380 TaxID=3364566 RepID=UPI0036A8E057